MLTKTRIKNILLVDISTYQVSSSEIHRNIFEEKLKLQNILWENRTGRKMARKGLNYSRGLLSLATHLLNAGFQVKYLVHADLLDREKIYDLAKEADAVCLNALTPTIKIAATICTNIKLINPKIVTIVGGPHATSAADETIKKYPDFDFVMIGDGEIRLPLLLKNLENPHHVEGIAFKDSKQQVFLNKLPSNYKLNSEISNNIMPAYSLLTRPLSNYAHNIKTYRGCPYKCNFCVERASWSNSSHSMRDSIQSAVTEIGFLLEHIEEGDIIHFSDTIFNIQWERTHEIAERLMKFEKKATYSFDTRVDLISEEQIKFLNKADFLYCRMGFESLHNEILNVSHKSITMEDQIEASKIIRSVANTTAILAYIITGMPGSTQLSIASDAQAIYNLIDDEIVDIVGNGIFVPYPGTPFYNNPSVYGITIRSKEWEDYDRRSFPVYELENLSSVDIFSGFLSQEKTLCQAYKDKVTNKKIDITSFKYNGLDYAYQNYIRLHTSE
ncbi:MAG: B12-binding domain-containing radical SAM protein [Anaerolineales bacterium]|nr:B12-binding domain-containing radical SAM protein [Anaerolineales bacterium]